MKRAWHEIYRLSVLQAKHKKKGWRLNEISSFEHLKDAAGELLELSGAHCAGTQDLDDELKELADVFGCLIGFAVKRGLSAEAVEDALLAKLELRFEE